MAFTLENFLTRDVTPPPHIIKSIMPVASKIMIAGPAKAGKSFATIQAALDLSSGRPLFGATNFKKEPIFPISRKYRTLYIEKEIGEWSLMDRMIMMTDGKALSNFDLIIEPRAAINRIDTNEGRKAIETLIKTYQPEIVILDPWAAIQAYDENSNQEQASMLRVIDGWMDEYKTSFIIVHHTGKVNPDWPKEGLERLRGASALAGGIDGAIFIDNVSGSDEREPDIKLTFDGLRHGIPMPKMYFRRGKHGLLQYLGETYKPSNSNFQPKHKPVVDRNPRMPQPMEK